VLIFVKLSVIGNGKHNGVNFQHGGSSTMNLCNNNNFCVA